MQAWHEVGHCLREVGGMKKFAYYNEHDPFAAAWIRELIKQGLITDGEVDERSIEDVLPSDVRGFNRCHFFAGIAGWDYALRQSGWPDDRPVWTGSCPCQPFSAAGKGVGFDDERHLWPAFYHLIGQCKPAIVFGEQVASKAVDSWIDLVQADLEAVGYAFGSVPFPAAGVGAPHIRDRNYWVADSTSSRCLESEQFSRIKYEENGQRTSKTGRIDESTGGLADTECIGRRGRSEGNMEGLPCEIQVAGHGEFGGLGNSIIEGLEGQPGYGDRSDEPGRIGAEQGRPVAEAGAIMRAGQTNGFWRDADWLGCRDGKWRPVEPGTFPLAHGLPARVGRLRGYGNAINTQAAKAFIESYLEI